ncbi:MAG TPA: type II toxin-antitoxin system VapC family toxin [Candidatus Baltobacteraceae bacterium]|nr:type II toxin-antitoxin system VapC family toxin [Candidatus Baltobacteraceae bacterium]
MKGFLVDTCAVFEFTKQSPNLGLVSWLARVDSSIVYLSAISIGELRYGISVLTNHKRRSALERWLRADVLAEFNGRILSFNGDVAERWGRLRADARKRGTPLPVIDAMIAATAAHYNLGVVTRNESDFEQMGIDVINPWS